MLFRLLSLALLMFFTACTSSDTKKSNLDGKKLLADKCSSCHNIDLPPTIYEKEIAPPMMAVSFHVVNFVKTSDESQRVTKAKEFVKDYVINPSESKSFCDETSLKTYGLMPSLKGQVSSAELDAITEYMFDYFTQANLAKEQEIQNKLKAMPAGKLLALKNNCLTCHKVQKDLLGPSFKKIALKYKNDKQIIIKSIKHGSSKKYKSSKGAVMPAFKNLSDKDIQIITKWILQVEK